MSNLRNEGDEKEKVLERNKYFFLPFNLEPTLSAMSYRVLYPISKGIARRFLKLIFTNPFISTKYKCNDPQMCNEPKDIAALEC